MKSKKKKEKNKTCRWAPPGHRPPSAQPTLDTAVALYAAGKYAEALALIEPVLAAQPTNVVAINIAAACSRALGKAEDAEKYWWEAVRIQPDYTEALNNLGVLLKEQGRFAEAEEAYRRVLVLRPDDAEVHNILGVLLQEQQRFVEAEDAYRRALVLRPNYVDAHSNLGMVLKEQQRFAEAEAALRRALVIRPDSVDARFNLSLLLLFQGRFDEGWRFYEARYDPSRKGQIDPLPNLPFPQWAGEPLHGKSIVVWPEQGYGDEIQFVRYLPLLKSLGAARVTLVCKPPLAPLFHNVPGADQVIGLEGRINLKPHDYWTFALSMPLRCQTTLGSIPANLPYLSVDETRRQQWAARLPAAGLRVGLVWKGSSGHKNDANRSLPGLAILQPLWSVAGISFVSLQKGNGEEEAGHPPPEQPILHLGPDIRDFADTAALVSQLDLVICVDTAIAHLAGALGRPCWVLLPRIGTDWRWLEDREDSPWYPGVMRLFRQTSTEGWTETIEKVAEALALWSATRQESAGHSMVAPAVATQGIPPPPLPGAQQSVDTAVARYAAGKYAEALALIEPVLAAQPTNVVAINIAAACSQGLGKAEDAEKYWLEAVRIQPDYTEALNNLGVLLKEQGRFAEAEEALRRALVIRPTDAEVHSNLGMLLKERKRFVEAEEALRRALVIRPDYADARFNLSLLLLFQGRFDEGWQFYEARYDPSRKGQIDPLPNLPFPQWAGQPLHGKSIVVLPEQGFGDEIQFVRYLPLLKALGAAEITLVCKQPLAALFSNLADVDRVIGLEGQVTLKPHDYWVFSLSLPLRFQTGWDSIPTILPYLTVDETRRQQWTARLPATGLRVGLVWKGSSGHKNDANRSLPGLAILQPLWLVAGISFVSLQKGNGEDEAGHPPPAQPILHLGPDIRDFADTAALVAQMDLVICVDTAIAHLAGALGRPCWVLLPRIGTDWRWLEDREDSPWYPGAMRLFRQAGTEGWTKTIEKVAEALALWSATRQESARCSIVAPAVATQGIPPPSLPGGQQSVEAAVALYAAGKYAEALALIEPVLAAQPTNVVAINIAAACSQGLGKAEDAEKYWLEAVRIQPDYTEALNNLGVLLKEQQRFAEAEEAYRRVLVLRPDDAEVHNILGVLLQEQRRFVEAEDAYRRAIVICPGHADAHSNLGMLLKEQRRFAEAEEALRRALVICPGHAGAHNNLGMVLGEQQRFTEAEGALRRAIVICPAHADAYSNLGRVLGEQGRFIEAEDAYRRALVIRSDHVDASFNLSLLLLLQGRFEEGWPLYEARLDPNRKEKIIPLPNLPFPQWAGQPLHGKSIVVWSEQGFGDEIQFARYLPLLKALGAAEVTLVCKPPLASLFGNLAGADRVIGLEGQIDLKPHDYWVFALSLPLRCQTTLDSIPTTLPYLTADETRRQQWAVRLPAAGLRVGLVWKGSRDHKNDANRSLPGLAILQPLWSVAGISFVSLQKGHGEDEAGHPPPEQPILHLGPDIRDFGDTAALVAQMDLIICVDTAIAHLAGALGKPCWVLLPRIGTDWRWLEDREDSPWYPGVMRLFRQAGTEGWTETIEKVAEALALWSTTRQESEKHSIVAPAVDTRGAPLRPCRARNKALNLKTAVSR